MSSDIYTLLARELGAARVLRDEERLEAYASDQSGLGRFPPECAVVATSAEEVELVLRLAAEHRVRCGAARLEEARGPEPLVDPDRVHAARVRSTKHAGGR